MSCIISTSINKIYNAADSEFGLSSLLSEVKENLVKQVTNQVEKKSGKIIVSLLFNSCSPTTETD